MGQLTVERVETLEQGCCPREILVVTPARPAAREVLAVPLSIPQRAVRLAAASPQRTTHRRAVVPLALSPITTEHSPPALVVLVAAVAAVEFRPEVPAVPGAMVVDMEQVVAEAVPL